MIYIYIYIQTVLEVSREDAGDKRVTVVACVIRALNNPFYDQWYTSVTYQWMMFDHFFLSHIWLYQICIYISYSMIYALYRQRKILDVGQSQKLLSALFQCDDINDYTINILARWTMFLC